MYTNNSQCEKKKNVHHGFINNVLVIISLEVVSS